jgi:hypothetical protein
MPQSHTKTPVSTTETENGHTPARKPSEQALEVVDTTFGAVPRVADAVRKRVDQLRDPDTRSHELETIQHQLNTLRDPSTRDAELESLRQRLNHEVEQARIDGPRIRRKVTGQFVDQAKKARERVEPVYRERVEPVVKPVYRERVAPVVEPVYRQRVEPTVKRVRERI